MLGISPRQPTSEVMTVTSTMIQDQEGCPQSVVALSMMIEKGGFLVEEVTVFLMVPAMGTDWMTLRGDIHQYLTQAEDMIQVKSMFL